jgi:hypothetical protein
LLRYQGQKEEDLKKMMVSWGLSWFICTWDLFANLLFPQRSYIQNHVEWAKKNLESWQEAKAEIDKI